MALGTYTSEKFSTFGDKCISNYFNFNTENKNEYITTCKKFGSDFKESLNAELNFKLSFSSDSTIRIQYAGKSLDSVVNSLINPDYKKGLSKFNNAKKKYINDVNNYFKEVKERFINSHKNLSKGKLLLKGHFQNFYNICIVCAKNLENGKGVKDIKNNLSKIKSSCIDYSSKSKKNTDNGPNSKTLEGRSKIIGLILTATQHLSEFEF